MDKVNYLNGGYKTKYHISKVDNTPVDPEANYFVMRLDKDPNAIVALNAYANSVEETNPEFAEDLRNMIAGVTKGKKLNELVDSQTGKMFPTTEPEIPKLENVRTFKVGDLVLGFHIITNSSNVEAIAYYEKQPERGDTVDIIFVLYKGNKMYAHQTAGDARSHFAAMLEPATSVGSYCHKLKGFGFESNAVPTNLIIMDYAPEPEKRPTLQTI